MGSTGERCDFADMSQLEISHSHEGGRLVSPALVTLCPPRQVARSGND